MADTPEAGEKLEKYPRNAVLAWKIVNLGIPAFVLMVSVIDRTLGSLFVILFGHVVILLANLWVSWRLSRSRLGPCVGLYLGSVLLGCGLTFLGCMANLKNLRYS